MATETATKTKKKTRGGRAGSKSNAVRAYLQRHPAAGPTAVANALKAKGIVISAAHVSNVKTAMAKKAGAASTNGHANEGTVRGGRKRAVVVDDAISFGQLLEARKFAAQVGGVDQAVSLLQSLAKLQ
jgi:hypothetical protein